MGSEDGITVPGLKEDHSWVKGVLSVPLLGYESGSKTVETWDPERSHRGSKSPEVGTWTLIW